MRSDDEHTLVRRASHDPEAFRELYARYFPRVYAYVAYRVGSAQDAEDLVSEVFTKVIEGIDGFRWRHPGSFAAWLFRIAHNSASDHYRDTRSIKISVPLEELPEMEASQLLPDDVVLQQEQFAYLKSLIVTLPPRQQVIVTLKFYGELRNQEIAQVLGIGEKTVAAHLCRGLESLHRRYVEDHSRTAEAERLADGRA